MRLLFLVHRAPFPPDKGDRIRSFHLLEHLSKIGSVSLATLADEAPSSATIAELNRRCERISVVPVDRRRWFNSGCSMLKGGSATEGLFYSAKLKDTVCDWVEKYHFDAAIAFCSSMVQYLPRPETGIRRFVDLVDVDSEKWVQYAETSRWPMSALLRLESRRVRSLECRLAKEADGIALSTMPEVNLFNDVTSTARAAAIPNGVDFEYFSPRLEIPEPNTCVFIGALNYYANIDGICWFARQVWPNLHRQFPESRLRIVGHSPSAAVRALSKVPGIEVFGSVPDVRPYLGRSTISIAPLMVARGVQNKILESMAMYRPVVASNDACVGISVERDRELLIAETPGEWCQQIAKLWMSPTLRQQIARDARHYVEQNHSWETCLQKWNDWLQPHEQPATPTLEATVQ